MSEQTGAEKGIDQDPTRGQEKRQKAPSRPSLARRFFIALSAIAAVAAVAVLVCSSLIYQSVTVDDAGRMLESECRVVRASLRGDDTDVMRLTAFDSGDVRVTLVGTDGTVLYDNQNSVASMPNHADRPEIAEALADGTGSAERDSETSGYVSIYRAIRLANGNVLRLAVAETAPRPPCATTCCSCAPSCSSSSPCAGPPRASWQTASFLPSSPSTRQSLTPPSPTWRSSRSSSASPSRSRSCAAPTSCAASSPPT